MTTPPARRGRVLTRAAAAVILVPTLALAGCGTEDGTPAVQDRGPDQVLAPPSGVPVPDGEVTTATPVTVLDDGDGAELCLGGVAESYPPQCGGPPLVGWDWADHTGDFESSSGVRWGDFVVTGTFDGEALTPTVVVPLGEAAVAPDAAGTDVSPFATTCPEPPDGWVVDPARSTDRDLERAFAVAGRLDDYASSYVDDPRTPTELDAAAEPSTGDRPDDPPAVSPAIVNVAVTDDVDAAEEAIREVWGGGLCVTTATYTAAELDRIADEVAASVPGHLSSGSTDDRVEVGVVHDDGTLQAWLDQEHGEGVVVVRSALRPA